MEILRRTALRERVVVMRLEGTIEFVVLPAGTHQHPYAYTARVPSLFKYLYNIHAWRPKVRSLTEYRAGI